LREKTRDFLGTDLSQTLASSPTPETPKAESGGGGNAGSRFIDTVKKALIMRVRSQSVDTGNGHGPGQTDKFSVNTKLGTLNSKKEAHPEMQTPNLNVSFIHIIFIQLFISGWYRARVQLRCEGKSPAAADHLDGQVRNG